MPLPDISNHPSLNKERVAELIEQTAHDSSLFARLYSLFKDEGQTLIKDIVEGLEANDRSVLHDAIHKVKGSSAAMGASRIYELSSTAIGICRNDGDIGGLTELPTLLATEYASYCQEAKQYLGQR